MSVSIMHCAHCALCSTSPALLLTSSTSVSTQESVQTLVSDMGMHGDAIDVVRRIWTAHLTCCGVLEPDFVK